MIHGGWYHQSRDDGLILMKSECRHVRSRKFVLCIFSKERDVIVMSMPGVSP